MRRVETSIIQGWASKPDSKPDALMARRFSRLLAGLMLIVTFALLPGAASAKEISLPPDGVQLRPAALPGYDKARQQCVACHSAEYMQYQPPSAARPYWAGVVTRMKKVFNAPIDDADMPDIVDYLVKTYGNEQTGH